MRLMFLCSAATLTGETGTYVYMAPEMIRHELYTTKADVYSWGVLLAECLAQRPPYEGLYLTPVQVRTFPDSRHVTHEARDIAEQQWCEACCIVTGSCLMRPICSRPTMFLSGRYACMSIACVLLTAFTVRL